MYLRILSLICLSSVQLSESMTLQIEGNQTSFTFPLGVTSQIEFYVRSDDYFRIFVQHKAVEKDNYNTMCVVTQSASKVCNTTNSICRCPEDPDDAFILNKTFLQSDAGLWVFWPWQQNNISKTVNVSISDSALWTQSPFVLSTSQALRERNIIFDKSLTLQIEGNKTSFTFPLGVTSQIKFYVRNEKDFRIVVQHKASEKDNYDTMCFVYQSANIGCNTSNNICRCPQDPDDAFSLNKTFQQSDAGLWVFRPWLHHSISKTVNVSVVDSGLGTKSPFKLQTSPVLRETTRVPKDVLSQTTKTSAISTSQSQLTTKDTTSIAIIVTQLTKTEKTNIPIIVEQLIKTDVTSIAIIVVLSFITLLAIVLTSVVWRHQGIITRLRRPPVIRE
ncbi:uncharacterized protein LOC112568315 isoform X1 [Pomacea canaliculata]|uniref:uncharacterized protein LOC112568315 isoform X1 n=2 Tax=Pomacea canaliculata TaxID=400727 RepID=UPI000D733B5A|nr:uncharacterized protein LOC112568315 isoform X1 [Pomacea canaliculata]